MSKISSSEMGVVKDMYYKKKMHMIDIADYYHVSIGSVYYFMRKHNLSRRSSSESNKITYEKQPLSFSRVVIRSQEEKCLAIMGVMLYWAEGAKADKSTALDFANSDPAMILVFLGFLRKIFRIDEKKLRVYMYCYSNQSISEIISFWSKITCIPTSQFYRPYVRNDYNNGGRVMKHGLVHIRYNDKKLLSEIKKMIECYAEKYAPVV